MQTQFEFKPQHPPVTYHNTTGLIKDELLSSIRATVNQGVVVLDIFKLSNTAITPSEMLKYCEIKGYKYLITSVRRTINTLTNAGELIHLPITKMGPYGKPEGLWIYHSNYQ